MSKIQIQTNGPCAITIDGDAQVVIDQDEEQWVDCDWHCHAHGCVEEYPVEAFPSLMAEQGLQVISPVVCELGDGWKIDRQYMTGKDHPLSRPGRVIHFDQEYRQDLGHLMVHNVSEMAFDESGQSIRGPISTLPIAAWAKSKDAVIGMAHCQQWPWQDANGFDYPINPHAFHPFEAPVLAALGLLHYLGIETPGQGRPLNDGAMNLWTRLLNAGCHVGLVGGSDFTCINKTLGRPRTLVKALGPTYLQALAETEIGATVFSRGGTGRLYMTADGHPLASHLKIARGQSVEVEITCDSAEQVQLLLSGNLWTHVPMINGRGVFNTSGLSKSCWICARTENLQTSAIFIHVDDAPIGTPEAMDWIIGAIEHVWGFIEAGEYGGKETEVRQCYEAARERIVNRKAALP